jgi:hypothetical protein
MNLITFESLTLQERGHARGGIFRYYELLHGREGAPDNFYLSIGVLAGDFVSPRHRHNFDQVRFQLEGAYDFGADGVMHPGSIAYFPEGTRYGPQKTVDPKTLTLVLQMGGASGNGYMSEREFQRGLAELKTLGSFKDGVFTREKPGGGKINQDAYEAVWEHVNRRELIYPKERYTRAVFMEPENFAWVPSGPGLATKLMGVFNERGTKIAFHRLDAGAKFKLDEASLWFVWSGSGHAGDQAWRRWTTMRTEAGEHAEIEAAEPSQVLQMALPRLADAAVERAAA